MMYIYTNRTLNAPIPLIEITLTESLIQEKDHGENITGT